MLRQFLPYSALIVSVFVCAPLRAADMETGAVRLALIATSNVGLAGDEALGFADVEGVNLEQLLVELGGYTPANVHRISDADPAKLATALSAIVVKAAELKADGVEVQLLFYYTGHAATDGLHMNGQVLGVEALKASLRVVPADLRLIVLDACQSGQLFRSKGGRLVEIRTRPQSFEAPPDEVWLSSSGPEENALETERRRGSLFTHFLISGARGMADQDGDQQVTLGELTEFVLERTEAAAADLGAFQAPRWSSSFTDLVITDLSRAQSSLTIPGPVPAPLLLVDRIDEQVLAEIPAGGGGFLALPPGDYRFIELGNSRAMRVADLSLSKGENSSFRASERLVESTGVRTKGGMPMQRARAFAIGYQMQLGATPSRVDMHGLYLGVHHALGRGHRLGLNLEVGGAPVQGDRLRGGIARVAAGPQWSYDVLERRFRLGPGLRLTGGFLYQNVQRADDSTWGSWFGSNTGEESRLHAVVDARALGRIGFRFGRAEFTLILTGGAELIFVEEPRVFGVGSVEIGGELAF